MTFLVTWRGKVRPEWIDVNGHVNSTHYNTIVYEAQIRHTAHLGMGDPYVYTSGLGKMVVEQHFHYQRELRETDEISVRSWVLGVDAKRIHVAHQVIRDADGEIAATVEQLDLSVDLSTRRVTPFPADVRARMDELVTHELPDSLSVLGVPRFATRP
ncbi:thioesterase family protein [Rhodococcus sp. IEGM 1408]|uniref:thioesterase family protein n=1 Tax=Rhodococcus sp. IEGM 1408 TaxID=3082220 RepID=UPI002952F85B|nr:thioesterase family protein [Rhodococcus sp. IEGM 1408]MDV7999858.1 thioesterase family protein [Rhodococcus sp. IEGM 1408]